MQVIEFLWNSQGLGISQMSAMRPTRLTTTFTAGALTVALGAAMLVLPNSARAEEDSVPIDTKIMRNIMEGLGLKRDGEATINYQQRAPLVIPPGRALPPPEKSGAALESNPAWPVDPDVKRAKTEAKAAREASGNPEDVLLKEGRPLRPDEMAPGPKPRNTQKASAGSYESSPYGSSNPSKPSELGDKGNIFTRMFSSDKDEEVGNFTGEPPRASLTAPPPGYQTPSPDQPYGTGKDLSRVPKPGNYLQDHPVGVQ
jgi:hypothetical protein